MLDKQGTLLPYPWSGICLVKPGVVRYNKSMSKKIRQATEADAAHILAIYAPYIQKTAITFEYEVPSLAAFQARIRSITEMYPYLVCLIDQTIVGYAYAHKQMERAAYQWNAELSIYLDPTYVHQGIGKALYAALLAILTLQNVQNVYAGVTVPNHSSENLHTFFGFQPVGISQAIRTEPGMMSGGLKKTLVNRKGLPSPFFPWER